MATKADLNSLRADVASDLLNMQKEIREQIAGQKSKRERPAPLMLAETWNHQPFHGFDLYLGAPLVGTPKDDPRRPGGRSQQ